MGERGEVARTPHAAAAAPGLAEAAAAVRAVKRSRLPANRPLSFDATRRCPHRDIQPWMD